MVLTYKEWTKVHSNLILKICKEANKQEQIKQISKTNISIDQIKSTFKLKQ